MSEDGRPGLSSEELRQRVASNPLVSRLVVRRQVTSTNDELRALAAAGAASGTVLVAEEQTGGRGRRGRSWYSPPGLGLYLSILLRDGQGPRGATRWTIAAALATCEACRRISGREVLIEWPNDLVLEGRKIAGILAETRSSGQHLSDLVLGVGVNVHHRDDEFPPDLRGAAIALHPGPAGGMLLRERLAARLLLGFRRIESSLAGGEWASLAREWEAMAPGARDRSVRVLSAPAAEGGTPLYEGTTRGIDEDGALKVRRADGSLERVRTAETVVPVE